MEKINYQKKFFSLLFSTLFNAFFIFIFIFSSFFFLKSKDFGYLNALFVYEGLLVFFDLTVFNHLIKKISSFKNHSKKQNLISFFLRRILIFSICFLIFNLVFVKIYYWEIILGSDDIIDNDSGLSIFFSLIIPLIIILRILINYLRSIFIGFFFQVSFSKIQIFSSVIKLLILFIFLNHSKTIQSILYGYFLGLVVEFFLLFVGSMKFIKFKINFKKQYVKNPNYLVLFALSSILLANIDRIFLSYNTSLNILGEYNFFKVLLSSFFIISTTYFYNLFPEISKMQGKDEIIKKKIYKTYKSLNITIIPITLVIFLFVENFFVDFKIYDYLDINNIFSFKILLISAYFNTAAIIAYSFQVGAMYLKIPTFINCFLIIISLLFFMFFHNAENSAYVASVNLFLNVSYFFLNIIFLNKYFKRIFPGYIILKAIKNFIIVLFINIITLLTLFILFYNSSKIIFYLSIIFIIFTCLKLSEKTLNKYD